MSQAETPRYDRGMEEVGWKCRYEADTYNLTVRLFADLQVVSFYLEDLDEGITYYQECTAENIGKEIHRKLDLVDIANTFMLLGSEPGEKDYQSPPCCHLHDVEFGSEVHSKPTDSTFMVYRGGKVHMIHKAIVSKKVVRVPSMFNLSIVEKIDKAELLQSQFRRLKQKQAQTVNQLQAELRAAKKENQDLKREIQSIQNNCNSQLRRLDKLLKEKETKLKAKPAPSPAPKPTAKRAPMKRKVVSKPAPSMKPVMDEQEDQLDMAGLFD